MAVAVQYNNVNLGLIRTIKVEQVAKLDPHNTDMLYDAQRYTMRSALSITDTQTDLPPEIVGDLTPADIMNRIKTALLLPRRRFVYRHFDDRGATSLVDVFGDTEAANGPKPVRCDIVQVSDRTYWIEYIIDVAVKGCDANQDFASNRYETTHDIDHRGYSTITTVGRCFVRTDMGKSPDVLRWLVTPPMPAGFRRKSMYQVSEDGLSLQYKITDTELYLAPPRNAVDAHGRFSITANGQTGATMTAQVDLHLEGKKQQSKKQLVEQAIVMACKRLEAAGLVNDPWRARPFITGGAISEELFDNVVDVTLRGTVVNLNQVMTPTQAQEFWKAVWQTQFGIILAGTSIWKSFQGNSNSPTPAQPASAWLADAWRQAEAQAQATKAASVENNPDPKKKPFIFGAAVDATLVDKFGVGLNGTDQMGKVDPGLRGNVPLMAFIAAAFKDPCVLDLIGVKAQNAPGRLVGNPGVPHVPKPGEAAGYAFSDDNGASEAAYNASANVPWQLQEAVQLTAELGDNYNNSFDWRFDQLLELAGGELQQLQNGGATLVLSGQVEDAMSAALLDKPQSFGDPFPGFYESWYAEISNDSDMYSEVLPATVSGADGVAIRWANPLRTIRIKWAIVKYGTPPELPTIVGDSNTIVLRHRMDLPGTTISPDGSTARFECIGETVYQTISNQYAEYHYLIPPWLNIPMRTSPAPMLDPNVVVTGGPQGATQDALITQIEQIAQGNNNGGNGNPPPPIGPGA